MWFAKLEKEGKFTQTTSEQYYDEEQQQFLADRYGISKGMVSRYVSEKVNKSKQIIENEALLIGELKKSEDEKV